ncbi:unnamed protein product [Nesidiocoris tenuis]|uniref:Uncharacterized protein n=1 Tax=Nesidiocoris tenuis TaxID=355587 RepID=A0A6H5GLG0_9HEMI|nr:unnamed protein product [Nesidiocoris tenuis]
MQRVRMRSGPRNSRYWMRRRLEPCSRDAGTRGRLPEAKGNVAPSRDGKGKIADRDGPSGRGSSGFTAESHRKRQPCDNSYYTAEGISKDDETWSHVSRYT